MLKYDEKYPKHKAHTAGKILALWNIQLTNRLWNPSCHWLEKLNHNHKIKHGEIGDLKTKCDICF